MLRWYELLQFIVTEICKKYEVNKKVIDDDYSEKKAALTFERDMKEINGVLKTRVMFMFDEIEHICFQTSDTVSYTHLELMLRR